MNVIDSSAWIEYLSDAPNASSFAAPIADVEGLLVPSVVIFEVFKWLARQRGPLRAAAGIAVMSRGKVVDLDRPLAVTAAQVSAQHRLAMADAIIFATALRYDATLWTQDADFEGLPSVRYLPRA